MYHRLEIFSNLSQREDKHTSIYKEERTVFTTGEEGLQIIGGVEILLHPHRSFHGPLPQIYRGQIRVQNRINNDRIIDRSIRMLRR